MPMIITDSTCDWSLEEANRLGVELLSLKVCFGDQVFEDKRTITNEMFFEKLSQYDVLPTTSLLSVGDFLAAFERHPDEAIVVLALSSELSGTYQSAVVAKEEIGRSDIFVIDTRTVTVGLGLLVRRAIILRDAGKTAAEIAEEIERVKGKVRIYGVLNTLKYLVKGGRLSGVQGAIGGLLSIKPIVLVQDGIVQNVGKGRGSRAAVKALVTLVREHEKLQSGSSVAYAHAGNLPLLEEIVAALQLPPSDPPCFLGSTVGTYTGPGAVAVAFFIE